MQGNKFLLRPLFDYGSFFQNDNIVSILNRTQSVSHNNYGLSRKELVEIFNNLFLVIGIQ